MLLTISDINQFVYCPRKIYYTYVEPVPRKTTFKMEYGKKQHDELCKKEKRRSLKTYGLAEGTRHFGYNVYSKKYNLSGKLDILIDRGKDHAQRFLPVECKDTDYQIFNNAKYQLVAYAMAIEDQMNSSVNEGYIYIIPEEKAYLIKITNAERDYVKKIITSIHNIIEKEHYPEPRSRKRCWGCEYIRYCNDHDISFDEEMVQKNITLMKELFGG